MDLKLYMTGPLNVNTYVLKDFASKEAAIIDVGGSFEMIKSDVEKEGYTIKFILNTHGHFDHISGDIEIKKMCPSIPIYMHKDDLPHVKNLSRILSDWGFPPVDETPEITDFIDENSQLYLGDNKIQIFHTPGHSKGSLSFYVDAKLFSGDTLFCRSIGRTDFFDGDFETLINSIKTKLLTLPDDTLVFPGHGDPTKIKDEKISNLYLR